MDYEYKPTLTLNPEMAAEEAPKPADLINSAEKKVEAPAFTLENMNDVHYCRYEWYDGCDAGYYY